MSFLTDFKNFMVNFISLIYLAPVLILLGYILIANMFFKFIKFEDGFTFEQVMKKFENETNFKSNGNNIFKKKQKENKRKEMAYKGYEYPTYEYGKKEWED